MHVVGYPVLSARMQLCWHATVGVIPSTAKTRAESDHFPTLAGDSGSQALRCFVSCICGFCVVIRFLELVLLASKS